MPELASQVRCGPLWSVVVSMMPLEAKIQLRRACRSEKQAIANNNFLQHVLIHLFPLQCPERCPLTADECYENCLRLAWPQRQAHLARRYSLAGNGSTAQPADIVFTGEDLQEIFHEWRTAWDTSGSMDLPMSARREFLEVREAFNAYLDQQTCHQQRLLRLLLCFDIRNRHAPFVLPVFLERALRYRHGVPLVPAVLGLL